MRNFDAFLQPISKSAARHLLAMAGKDVRLAMQELARTGSVRINSDVKVTYVRRRYLLIDQSSIGGANLAPLLADGLRAALPAAAPDQDGTWAQRQSDQSERDLLHRTRELLLQG